MDSSEFSKEVVDRLDSGSLASRKFLLTIGSLVLTSVVCILAGFFSGLATILPTFVGGVLGILSLYFTGNVLNKFVVGKSIAGMSAPAEVEEPPVGDTPEVKK